MGTRHEGIDGQRQMACSGLTGLPTMLFDERLSELSIPPSHDRLGQKKGLSRLPPRPGKVVRWQNKGSLISSC